VAAADVERDVKSAVLLVVLVLVLLIVVLVEEVFEGAEPVAARAVVCGEGVSRPEHRVVQRLAQG
jgi:hypothetical protein